MNVDSSHLEQFLHWQVDAYGGDEAAELRQLLQKNRDRCIKLVEYREREVGSKTISRSEADRCRSIVAYLAAKRASKSILNETIASAKGERSRAIYRNKENGTPIEIPEIDVEKITHDVMKAQNEGLRAICSPL